VVKLHQGKFGKEEIIEAIQKYAMEHRGVEYNENDVKMVLNDLIKRGRSKR